MVGMRAELRDPTGGVLGTATVPYARAYPHFLKLAAPGAPDRLFALVGSNLHGVYREVVGAVPVVTLDPPEPPPADPA